MGGADEYQGAVVRQQEAVRGVCCFGGKLWRGGMGQGKSGGVHLSLRESIVDIDARWIQRK